MDIKQVTPSKNGYDVIVVGGGPSGSTAATLSAKNGLDVLLLDREKFPRFRVGESLMPATYPTFERLGVLERLRESAFPVKASVQFFSPNGRSGTPFYFSEVNPGPDATTWQVDRVEFDKMLLDNARAKGAEVILFAQVRNTGPCSKSYSKSSSWYPPRPFCWAVAAATADAEDTPAHASADAEAT